MNEQNKNYNDVPEFIHMPEHIKESLPSTARTLGEPAVRGVVSVPKRPTIPVENPSPAAIRRAGKEVMIDGKVGYVLPGQVVEVANNERK